MEVQEGDAATRETDPRLDDQFVRSIDADSTGAVHIVGVVHDHPASAYRAQRIVESQRPDVVALELSPLALPLFESYAEDAVDPWRLGGEFSAAVSGAGDADVVGIDAPNRRFLAALARECIAGDHSRSTVETVLRSTAAVAREAAACRLAAAVNRRTSFTVEVGERVAHECDRTDDPSEQAADESRQVRRARNVLRALERPTAVRLRDETREACMVQALDELRAEGDVVAVVGVGHLDAVAGRLREAGEEGGGRASDA